jgi:hypothetical protein
VASVSNEFGCNSNNILMKAFFGGGGDQSESSALMLGDAGRRLPRTRMSEDLEGSGLDAGVSSTATEVLGLRSVTGNNINDVLTLSFAL